MSRWYALPRGPRVRLRLARSSDRPAIAALLRRLGLAPDELELGRLVRSDPRRRLVICATALIGSAETVVGIGAIELGRTAAEPDILFVDEHLTEGLAELLIAALTGRARTLARARAA